MRTLHAALPPQILDVLDCTGSGDVETSKVVSAADGVIEGVFGNRLAVNPEWKNPTGLHVSPIAVPAVHRPSLRATCSVHSQKELPIIPDSQHSHTHICTTSGMHFQQ